MRRKILIEKRDNRIRTYFCEDGEIVEIHSTAASGNREDRHRLGDIYIGRVSNIVPNIGAAFIEIEKGINCYYDMKDAAHAIFTHKSGKKALCIGDELVVQISREAVKSKAPTVTGNLSFTGRYAVLTHGNTRIGVSSKIPKAMREEFKKEFASLENDAYGIIIRTNAKDAPLKNTFRLVSVRSAAARGLAPSSRKMLFRPCWVKEMAVMAGAVPSTVWQSWASSQPPATL